ncbi:MAG: response regulator transcription factor [Saprospiraceae bacterium]|nr:response regulator transcription factor [Saprospiraceae bacterium]
MKQIVIRFGLLAACLLILMQLGQYSMVVRSFSDELFFTLFAILFLSFGYIASRYIPSSNAHSIPNEELVPTIESINHAKIDELNISKREYQVLELICQGCSNQEISSTLYISESTVKSHVSNLLSKLDVKRRTQAIKVAKDLQLIQ